MNKNIFRMYDVRGIADKELTDENVYLIGKAFGTYIKRNNGKKITAGMDVRLSSPRIRNAFVKGVLSTGIDIIDIGISSSPMLYYAQHFFDADGGIMITGSHNPIEYNGLKMVDRDVTIYGDVILSFHTMIENKDFESGYGKLTIENIDDIYTDMCIKKTRIDRKLKVAVDAGNGTSGPIIEKILQNLNVEFKIINKKRDGTFPAHLPDPTVLKYMDQLIKMVKEENYDIGIGYDGDADRVGIIDERGDILFGDQVLGILSADMLSRNKGEKVIFDVKCSQGLEEYIKDKGGIPIMHKTGHTLLKRKMKEENALLAGEMSGHMFFNEDFYGFDDGIFASLKILSILSSSNKTIGEIKSDMPYYFSTPEIRVDCTDEDKFKIVENLVSYYKNNNYKLIDIDGVRVYFDDGWALIRASNTQPILVVRIESKTQKGLDDIKKKIRDKLSEFDKVNLNELQ